MPAEVNYSVNAYLRAKGGFIGQMARHAQSIGPVHKKLSAAGAETVRWGRMVQGSTAAAVVGWTKVGTAIAAVASAAAFGGLLKMGMNFNANMESATMQVATMFQLFDFGSRNAKVISGETSKWEHNLKASKAMMGEMFEIAKKTPATYGEVTSIYKSAVTGLATQTQDLGEHLKFMKKASLLGGLAGGDHQVLGSQLGRIMAGSAGVEMNVWQSLKRPLMQAGNQLGVFSKKASTDMTAMTAEFNKLGGDDRLKIMMSAMGKLGDDVAAAYANSMAGITSTTKSAIETVSGTMTKPLYEGWKSFLLRVNSEAGVFGDKNMGKWVKFAQTAGEKLAEYAGVWLNRIETAGSYIRDNWVTIMQAGKNAAVIAAAAIKGAFFIGVSRMLAGTAMIAAGRGMQAAGAIKRGTGAAAGFLGRRQKEAHAGIVRGGVGKGRGMFGMLGKLLPKKGPFAAFKKGEHSLIGMIARVLSFSSIVAAGIPLLIGVGAAFGAVLTIVGGMSAYVISNWKAISAALIAGMKGGTITLRPLLMALYGFWGRLKIVGELFLGAGNHADKFNNIMNMFVGVIEIASGAIAFFMKAIAISLGVWGALKLAFQGVLRAVLAIIEAASYLPGGPGDETVARARANYEKFSNGVQDTFTDVDTLLRKADEIQNFKFTQLDLASIDKDAAALEKSLADMLKGKGEANKLKGARGPKVKIGVLNMDLDFRGEEPDRLMGALMKPLARMADQRVQAFDALEDGV